MQSHMKILVLIYFTLITRTSGSSDNDCGQIVSSDNAGFPWTVGIYVENENQVELICLGSIIQDNAVLTGAHCFSDNIGNNLRNGSFYIATGVLKKQMNSQPIPSNFQKIDKTDINIQKYYKGLINFFSSDLAIVKGKFDTIKSICVDWVGDLKDSKSHGKQSIWHKNKIINVEQSYLDSEDCEDEAPKHFIPFITTDKQCAKIKDSGVSSNHESEGSGIVFFNSDTNRWYLKGVTSMYESSQGKLFTYTMVNQYLNWISNIVATL